MTQIRQLTQVFQSATYTDGTAPTLANFQTNPTNLETDVNNLRSAVNNILSGRVGNWYDDPFSGSGGAGGTNDIPMTGLNQVPIGCFTDLLTDITVSNAQNWEILNVAASEAPSVVGSLANTTEGAIVAQSADSGAAFDDFELTERAGSTAVSPNNLLIIRDATTGQQLQSDGRDVFGLLQVESTFTDGNAFNDVSTGDRVKISFVRLNAGLDDLEAAPVADIEDAVINYNYPSIVFFKNVDPSCFTGGRGFIDQAASVDVTLQNAYNGGSVIVTSGNTINFSGAAGNGGFSVSMVDAVAVGVATQTAADTSGNTLTLTSGDGLGTGSGGAASITAGDSGVGATGAGGDASLIAGAAASDAGAGGDAIITAGASTGATAGGNVILTSGASGSGVNGFISVLSSADEDEALMVFTPSGTAETVGFYSGTSDPNTVTTATRGSIFMRDTGATGEVWVNTDNATAWTLLQAGAAVVTLEAAWAAATGVGTTLGDSGFIGSISDTDTYLINTVTGTDTLLSLAAVSGADVVSLGHALEASVTNVASGTGGTNVSSTGVVAISTANAADASGNDITVTAGNSTAGTAGGGGVTVNGGDGFGTGSGGALSMTAGDSGAGATGNGGGITLSTGVAASTNGSGGGFEVTTGSGTGTGDGGNIDCTAGAGGNGAGGNGGDLSFFAGPSGNGATGGGGAVDIFTGSSFATNGAGGDFTVITGDGEGTGAGGAVAVTTGGANGTGTAGAFTVNTGNGAGGAGGAITLATGDGGNVSQGGGFVVTAGAGGTTAAGGVGGNVSLTAGAGRGTASVGGDFIGTAGGGSGTSAGGVVNIDAGQGGLMGAGGQVLIDGGAGGGTSGSGGGVFINGGTVTSGQGGNVNITGANSVGAFAGVNCQFDSGDAGTVGNGGGILITSGAGGSTSGNGGLIQLTAAAAPTSGNGGDIELRAGAGTDDNGRVIITPNFANADTDEYITLVATGTNPPNSGGTQNVRMLAGGRDPDTNVTATPGSLYLRGDSTTSQLYVNTTSGTAPGTTWIPAGSTSVATIYFQGEANTGISAGTNVSDQAAASNITLDTNSPTFPTFPATAALFFSRVKVWLNGNLQRNGIDVVRSGTQSTAIQFPLVALLSTDVVQIDMNQF